ncbi:ATP-binding cassette domain-containing protein [Guyparkeria halophila]|uniref:ATP-binding cassette domain-containing protein n=1 Tax=Guyparkeria halophila TaxID=47960 RepID=A0A6I6CY37_9GAMM|nr:ABC transporter ATP-binding protein [Guyparkeria halophila]QGT78300.1 ATP-binding cassette domain-containing protein [Guyparkeria halophila]
MLQKIKELYRLLTPEQRGRLLRLQILVVLMSVAEIAGVISIGPFMGLVADMQQLQGDGLLADLFRASGLAEPREFLFWVGVGVLGMLTLAAIISMVTVWRLSLYGAQVGAELASRLFRHYMHQEWLFHSSGSSSQLTNQISKETQRITSSIITPLMQINAKLVMASLMALTIVLYDPVVAVVGLGIFGLAYLGMYRTVRRRLATNGEAVSRTERHRFKLMAEGFGGIKDVLLLGRQDTLIRRFEQESAEFALAQGTTLGLSQIPRYAMELIAFGSMIFLVLYLLASHEGNLGTILPVLSVYALAGFKILPALQQVYQGVSQIRGNLAAFEAVREDLRASVVGAGDNRDEQQDPAAEPHWTPRESIEIRGVTFRYPGKQAPALKSVELEIPANGVIGLVGASGSGKSTAIDLLLGLIFPETGEVRIDGQPLTCDNRRAWQNSVGFVPQAIFLADSSIRENIAFGLAPEAIDDKKVRRAATMAHLDEVLAELPQGLETRVGERGVQLSGGQRQRIGIARALYHDADVLVLDEATSALDGITERLVMDAIHDFSGKKTIIMIAHRLATVKQCDRIYLMSDGRVIDRGSFDELAQRNAIFKRMADHA